MLVQLDERQNAEGLEVSMIRDRLWSVALGSGLALLVLALMWPLLRWQFPEWLAEQPAVAWAILGLIWWPCLTPSWLGLVWLSLAAFYALRHLWREAPFEDAPEIREAG